LAKKVTFLSIFVQCGNRRSLGQIIADVSIIVEMTVSPDALPFLRRIHKNWNCAISLLNTLFVFSIAYI
ncbi:MAG: hypothetical protein P8184_20560, partial [Calditrichia bacterium]